MELFCYLREFTDRVHSEGYEFTSVSGEVTRFYESVDSFLDANCVEKSVQQGVFRENVFFDLSLMEKLLDRYSALLSIYGTGDKTLLYPNVSAHVNIMGVMLNFPVADDRSRRYDAPRIAYFSDRAFDAVKALDSVSYEWIQALAREMPELLVKALGSAKEGYPNYILSMETVYYLRGNPDEIGNYPDILRTRIEGRSGILARHFDSIGIAQQRRKRLELGLDALKILFEETKSEYESKKEEYFGL